MNRKLALSLASIAASVALIAGATFAFFNDTETSKDNLFQAGKLDLKIDNTSYYNGKLSEGTSWKLKDLAGELFFNFDDVKPGDEGEDTISLHVFDNNAWACADFTITSNDDVDCSEPEKVDDPSCNDPDGDITDGELGDALNFIFWTDDGDNVLEDNENLIASGSASQVLNSSMTLADSETNNVGGIDGTPLIGSNTYYIGKAWCFGSLTPNPVPEGKGESPVENSGVLCDGSALDNSTQSDLLMGDITFYAEQSRNNDDFLCSPVVSPSPSPVVSASPESSPVSSPSPTPLEPV